MPPATTTRPIAMTIAGSDCSCGAGIQADLKTFSAYGVHGLTALTCAVAETPKVVEAVLALPPDFVASQIRLMLAAYPVGALKTGMLFSAAHIEAVLAALAGSNIPLVVDPVMIATSGAPLVEPDAITMYRERMLPRATLITPNLDEACVLLGQTAITRQDLPAAASALHRMFGCAVLLKGGHLRDGVATDLLVSATGQTTTYDAPYIEGISTHGTGCTYSAAIAAGLACGRSLEDAVASAKSFISGAIARSFHWQGPDGGTIDALDQITPHDTNSR